MKFLRSCLRTLVQDFQRTLVGGVGFRQPTTLTIDDELFGKAVALALALAETGIERTELLRECIKAFIQRQTARRLAALGEQLLQFARYGGETVSLALEVIANHADVIGSTCSDEAQLARRELKASACWLWALAT